MLSASSPSVASEVTVSSERMPETTSSTSKRDPNRFYCPYEGCNRSFAELWRLKVHYRAAPDIRGSGKERGHGAELEACPKCGAELKPGRHHVGCAAGKRAATQLEKRRTLKGRKRSGCQDVQPKGDSPKETGNTSMQAHGTEKPTTALGVPVSWMQMPLDFDQFFLPMDSGGHVPGRTCAVSEADSVGSWIYGNQGELPTMAMAQVALDSDFEMDFSRFFENIEADPRLMDPNLHTIKEEMPYRSELMGDSFPATLDDPLYDGLDKYLTEPPEARHEGRGTTDCIGKKRERRSSLEQRLEQRNGKEPNRRRSIASRDAHDRQEPNNTQITVQEQHRIRNAPLSFSGEYTTNSNFYPGLPGDTGFPFEMTLETVDYEPHSLHPYTLERGNDVGLLVQDMVGFDIQRCDEAPQSLAQEKRDN